jgi:phosphopantothenoylcysteine decarboxylase/phosphopantothenate--cysteine ligase
VSWLTHRDCATFPVMLHGRTILLGVSGSIAAYKAVDLARRLVKAGANVQVIMTDRARAFVTPLTFRAVTGRKVMARWDDTADTEIAHVELGYRIDAAVVAPATAQTIARLALGFADDALSATLLSHVGPLLIAPAMESRMWAHPATAAHVATLRERGVRFVGPVAGELASGRSGHGRMAEPDAIVAALEATLASDGLADRTLLITAGPTWERLDPVRILTSRATGTFGVSLAEAAVRRGARVRLVAGPGVPASPPHPRLERTDIESALDLERAVTDRLDGLDALIATAAVSDFRPAHPRDGKLKRSDPAADRLDLVENPDVLATAASELRRRGARTVVVGFAAETSDVEAHAEAKREKKGCDFMVANRVGVDRGFGAGSTEVVWLGEAVRVAFGPGSKPAAADFVLDRLEEAVRQRAGADG